MLQVRRFRPQVSGSRNDRTRALLAAGRDLLRAGRSREAADAFGRVLLHRADAREAQRGIEDARRALAEEARQLEARMEEARTALSRGEQDAARALLEDVVRRGGDRDRALELLDRLGERGGRVELPRPTVALPAAQPENRRPRAMWSRRVFVVCASLAFGLLAAGVAFSWERLVESLVKAPSPSPHPPAVAPHDGARR